MAGRWRCALPARPAAPAGGVARPARPRSGRPSAHATGVRALTARGAAAPTQPTRRTPRTGPSSASCSRCCGMRPRPSRAPRACAAAFRRAKSPPRAQVPPPRAAPKPRPVPRGHPGPTCSSDGAGCVAAGLARTEPRVSLVAAPRSLLGVGSPAKPACRAGRVREDPGPAGWWPLAGPARVRARLAGWSPPRVAAGRPGAPLRAPRRPVAAPETKTPRPAARPRSAGGSKGRSRSPPRRVRAAHQGRRRRRAWRAGDHCPSAAGGAAALGARAPAPGFLRSGPRFFGRPR